MNEKNVAEKTIMEVYDEKIKTLVRENVNLKSSIEELKAVNDELIKESNRILHEKNKTERDLKSACLSLISVKRRDEPNNDMVFTVSIPKNSDPVFSEIGIIEWVKHLFLAEYRKNLR